MTLLFDKHRIISPALVPSQPREAEEFGGKPNADAVLTIGLVNNMPDAALKATERQFARLLSAAAGDTRIHFHRFSLPSVNRSQSSKGHIDTQYTDIADLGRLQVDGLIVTGAEPNAKTLQEEPFWKDLTDIIDWARTNTRSAIWSCLAAHAAVKYLDGIDRHRLDVKCSGIYDCTKLADDWLISDVPSPLKVAHSRLNELRESELVARGYRILTASRRAGVDIFSKQFKSQFVFFQGHPEYDTLSLQREYLRDITRYLTGERDSYPAFPADYFDGATESRLASFQKRATAERKLPLSVELPNLVLRPDIAAGSGAAAIFKNWLGYLSEGAKATLPPGGHETEQ